MSQAKVYLIDDDEDVLATYSFIAKRYGLMPVCISDPLRALNEDFPVENGCIVLDLTMPTMNGLDLLKAFQEKNNTLPVIIASGHVDVSLAVECMELGAFTLIEKPIKSSVLIDKIQSAIQHINTIAETLRKRIEAQTKIGTLTSREREVAYLLADGLKASRIAEQLHISSRTVESHRENLLRKLHLNSPSQISGMLAVSNDSTIHSNRASSRK